MTVVDHGSSEYVQPLQLEDCQTVNLALKKRFPNTQQALIALLRYPYQLDQLQTLIVKGVVPCNKGQNFDLFIEVVRNAPNIRILKAQENNIGPRHMEVLKDAILHPKNRMAMASEIKQNLVLEVLNLDANRLGKEGAKVLGECVSYCPNLQHLSLFDSETTSRGLQSLCYNLGGLSRLDSLDIGRNAVFDAEEVIGDAIFFLLSNLKSLTTLYFYENFLGEYSTHKFREGMEIRCNDSSFSNLTLFWLSDNVIGSRGIHMMCSGPWMSFIQDLDIQGCGIGDRGLMILSHFLKEHKALDLVKLNLADNAISDNGMLHFCEFLQHSKISHLILDRNWKISSFGIQRVLDIMNRNPCITFVRCDDIYLSDDQSSGFSYLHERNMIFEQYFREEIVCIYLSRVLAAQKYENFEDSLSIVSSIIEMAGSVRKKYGDIDQSMIESIRKHVPLSLHFIVSDNLTFGEDDTLGQPYLQQDDNMAESDDTASDLGEIADPKRQCIRVDST
jgi:Ran GTPase-activating protein (RanGAP) involved in mRNA processing and transport